MSFLARTRWSAERPESLVVCCSDGRWHAAVEEFIRAKVSARADLFAVPGGPAWFDQGSASYEQARVLEDSFQLLARFHDLRTVWLIAHQDCAYYRARHPGLSAERLAARQHTDLREAQRVLNDWHPHLAIHRVYAALEGECVVFTVLPDE